MNYLSYTRRFELAAAGVVTVALECGVPYKDYTAFVAIAGAGTISVSIQPLFGGANDGSAVVYSAAGLKKAYQSASDEIRPPTTGLQKNPADSDVVAPVKSELQITNNGTGAVVASVYMSAIAGGGL